MGNFREVFLDGEIIFEIACFGLSSKMELLASTLGSGNSPYCVNLPSLYVKSCLIIRKEMLLLSTLPQDLRLVGNTSRNQYR